MISAQWKPVWDEFRFRLWLHIYPFRRTALVTACSAAIVTGFYFMLIVSQFDDPLVLNTEKKNTGKILYPHPQPLRPRPHKTFRFLINEPHFCIDKKFLLLIAVSSSPSHVERRIAIRKTWGNRENLNSTQTSLVFLLGKVNDTRLEKQIHEESMNHRDIIQGNFMDTYKNLTLKSVMALKWFSSYCPAVRFFMKTDDDVYVNTKQLSNYLQRRSARKRWLVGCVKTHARMPLRIQKNRHLPMRTLPVGHPVFVAGAGYVVSGDIVEELYEASTKIIHIPVEDVFVTGYCAKAIGIKPEHDSQFSCGDQVRDYCRLSNTMLTGHHVTAEKQVQIWNFVHQPQICKKSLQFGQ